MFKHDVHNEPPIPEYKVIMKVKALQIESVTYHSESGVYTLEFLEPGFAPRKIKWQGISTPTIYPQTGDFLIITDDGPKLVKRAEFDNAIIRDDA